MGARPRSLSECVAMDSGQRLPDRDLLAQRLTRSVERARRYPGFHYAVMSIDLGLGPGPDAGLSGEDEAVLAAAVRRLESCLRVSDLPPTLRHGDLVVHVHEAEVAFTPSPKLRAVG